MSKVESILKGIRTRLNKREYEQFIVPLIQAIEENQAQLENHKVKQSLDNIIFSALHKLNTLSCEINGEDYVKLSDMERIVLEEYKIKSE